MFQYVRYVFFGFFLAGFFYFCRNFTSNGSSAATKICSILDSRTPHGGSAHRPKIGGRNFAAAIRDQPNRRSTGSDGRSERGGGEHLAPRRVAGSRPSEKLSLSRRILQLQQAARLYVCKGKSIIIVVVVAFLLLL